MTSRHTSPRFWLLAGLWLLLIWPASGAPGGTFAPPLPPLPPSPISLFRTLLNTNSTGRIQILANRPLAQQQALESKLTEYQALPPAQRELRLTLTELRWYLPLLMPLAKEQRLTALAQIPVRLRPMLEERLNRWDALPPETRQSIFTNAEALNSLVQIKAPLPPTPALPTAPKPLSPGEQQQIQSALTAWCAWPAPQRTNMLSRFKRFLDLPPVERAKTLRQLPENERHAAEQVVQAFEQLAPPDRTRCLASFSQFGNLSAEERVDFLANAERWQSMTPQEKQSLRRLVNRPPPLPPLPPTMVPLSFSNHHPALTNALVMP